jgi:2,3-bisphosphoglycerate-independent phosphoglycerate mutase
LSPTAAPAESRRKFAKNLCALLAAKIKKIGDTEVIIKAGKEHRFVVIFRGKGLEGPLTDADPNREGFAIPTVHPRDENNAGQKKMAALIADFYKAALPVIAKEKPANGFLMRGIAHQPHIPLFEERYSSSPRASRFIRCIRASRNSSA